MSEEDKYSTEVLKTKTSEELIKMIGDLREEVAMLDFLIAEYEGAQESLGRAMTEQLTEHLKNAVLSNTKGEA